MSKYYDDDSTTRDYLNQLSHLDSIENLLVLSHVLNSNFSKLSFESLNYLSLKFRRYVKEAFLKYRRLKELKSQQNLAMADIVDSFVLSSKQLYFDQNSTRLTPADDPHPIVQCKHLKKLRMKIYNLNYYLAICIHRGNQGHDKIISDSDIAELVDRCKSHYDTLYAQSTPTIGLNEEKEKEKSGYEKPKDRKREDMFVIKDMPDDESRKLVNPARMAPLTLLDRFNPCRSQLVIDIDEKETSAMHLRLEELNKRVGDYNAHYFKDVVLDEYKEEYYLDGSRNIKSKVNHYSRKLEIKEHEKYLYD